MKINKEVMKLYAVTDRSWLEPGEELTDPVGELLEAGVTCVQLREKDVIMCRLLLTTGRILL